MKTTTDYYRNSNYIIMKLKPFEQIAALVIIGLLTMMPQTVFGADAETINDQVTRQKEVDNGGSGRYRAIVVSEKTLPDFTVYRPRNVQYAARREGPLPILIWCNGACSGSSIGYERMLNEMASHGYVVVGIGAFEMTDSERDDGGSDEKMVGTAISWLVKQEKLATSDYYHAIDLKNIALSGHSCGGAQAIANCANSRVKTLLIMNAGMGGMSMGGASPQSLNSLPLCQAAAPSMTCQAVASRTTTSCLRAYTLFRTEKLLYGKSH